MSSLETRNIIRAFGAAAVTAVMSVIAEIVVTVQIYSALYNALYENISLHQLTLIIIFSVSECISALIIDINRVLVLHFCIIGEFEFQRPH